MVAAIINRLDSQNLLDNTYIVYTTDNGFHIGNHRLPPGKRCPYEEDVNIPLYIRGPDVPAGVTSNGVHSHVDMAPTILQMLDVPILNSYQFDGDVFPYTSSALGQTAKTELLTVEFWNGGPGSPEGVPDGEYYNNTYKALRVISDGSEFAHSFWVEEAFDVLILWLQTVSSTANGARARRSSII
jgi:N-acetylglucosamine-6-sulfatase